MSGRAVQAGEEPSRGRERRALVRRELVQTVKECLQAWPVEMQHKATERAEKLTPLVHTAKEVQSRGMKSCGLRLPQRMLKQPCQDLAREMNMELDYNDGENEEWFCGEVGNTAHR